MINTLKKLKPLMPVYILTFAFCFMLIFYEPIIIYANNIEDCWFDIYIMIGPIILLFLLLFTFISAIYTIIYFAIKKFFKKMYFYRFCVLGFFVMFLYLYIQGNYLIGNLPDLDGATIDWSKYLTQNIISIIVFVSLIIIQIVLLIKYKFNKCLKIVKYVSLVVVGMLSTSLVSVLLTTDVFVYKKETAVLTREHINTLSNKMNFLIFVVDSVDSVYFNDILNESDKYKPVFKDFTYYPDTVGAYGFTRESIPFILTGIWNENKTSFTTYSTNALNDSKLINELIDNGYKSYIYESELIWEDEKSTRIENGLLVERKLDIIKFIKQKAKVILFKYLPYGLKKYSSIDSLNYNCTKVLDESLLFNFKNLSVYKTFKNNKIEKIDDKVFQFLHVEGAHTPFDQDENFNFIENGTYEQKILATMNLIDAYINRLKENDIYDNSAIIIMSDHGYNFTDHKGRQNPILFIKGINERHSSMKISDKAISYDDLQDAYFDLIDGKTSKELFKDIGSKRERRYIYYSFGKEKYMYEYIQTGKAWDEDTLIATGEKYILD